MAKGQAKGGATDIFGTTKVQTAHGKMQFGTSEIIIGKASTDLVVQQVQAQVDRPINKLYEIGSTNMYYVAGRVKGQGVLKNVIGLTANSVNGMIAFGKLCGTEDKTLKIKAPTGDNVCNEKGAAVTTKALVFKDAALSSVAVVAQAEQDLITADWTYMFSDLFVEGA